MKYSPFGSTGIRASRIVLGSWYLPHSATPDGSGLYPVDRKVASDVIEKAFDLGINFFDTADVYRGVYNRGTPSDFSMVGNSERILGEALKGHERESFVLATKVMGRTGPGQNDSGLNRKHVMHAVARSLERLGLDYIDIYLMHAPDHVTGPCSSVRTMNKLIYDGRILHFGASNHSPVEMEELFSCADRNGLEGPSGVQEIFNLADRSFGGDMLKTVERHGAAAMIYSPLAQGILAGRYMSDSGGIPRGKYETFFKPEKGQKHAEGLDRLKEFANSKGMKMSQVSLAWLLARHPSLFPIVGASSVAQLEENVGACELELSGKDLEELESYFPVPEAD